MECPRESLQHEQQYSEVMSELTLKSRLILSNAILKPIPASQDDTKKRKKEIEFNEDREPLEKRIKL